MDDALLAAPTQILFLTIYQHLQLSTKEHGLQKAPEKFQIQEPWQYLGHIVFAWTIWPQCISLNTTHLNALNDFPKILGAINWIHPTLGITTEQLSNLFNILKGDTALEFSSELNP